ncbi:MAG: non-homologous end-joining DNA ligase [Geminicoccaceae bacterium]
MADLVHDIDGHRVTISHPEKVLFPEDGITKRDLADYYARIARIALPHWRDRPLTLQRFPDGIGKHGFFQKGVPEHFPGWIDRVELPKEGGTVTYLLANQPATLVYLADQACITAHLALARRDRPDHPDRLIFDLDPSDGDFARVQRAAGWLKQLLDALDAPSFVQTTGSRGLHVVLVLDRSAGFDETRAFARQLAGHLAGTHPETLTVEQRKAKREGRVYLDIMRNAYGQTAVAPYAVRARNGAGIATPLDWREALDPKLRPASYTMRNIFRRLGRKADPWRDIDSSAQSLAVLSKCFARLT